MIPKHYYKYYFTDIKALISGIFINREKETIKQLQKFYGNYDFYFFHSGRSCLAVLFKMLDYPLDSEVIIPVNCCSVVPEVVKAAGLKPVFVDIDRNLTIEPNSLSQSINSKTAAVVCVAMYGNVPNYDKINPICEENKIDIIQDLAHTFTAKYNNEYLTEIGIASIFSLNITKSINVFGGGILMLRKSIDKTMITSYQKRESFFTDIKRTFILIAFQIAIFPIIYKYITSKLIKLIVTHLYYKPPCKKLSSGAISLFCKIFERVEKIENDRKMIFKQLVKQFNIRHEEDILQAVGNREPSCLFLSIDGSKYDLKNLKKKMDFPEPLPLLKDIYHLREKFPVSEKIYIDIILIQTFSKVENVL